ncbi:Uncharacterized protein P5673_024040 [Acropora cervicornis]|uniref:Uncharacterized protein n=1 Tax=Acropora cervicornis TaxID=6130 RepID=A0AAD9UY65_ACRCE|nr:Uncharacterized protein P5673_024040 [Acropora cervicornis]
MASVQALIEQMSQTDIRRSIVVSNIPPETREATLTIHFQRRKYGGGDVLSINILQDSRHDGATAIVTFEAAETVETVLTEEHQFQGRPLKICRCAEKQATYKDDVFSQVTANLNPLVLDAKSQEIETILDRLKTEAGVSFEGEGRNFAITGSLKQINFCYQLLLSLLAEEQEISDKLKSCTFEDVDELAGQRVMGEAFLAGEKKDALESIGTIVARPMEERPSIKVQYLGNVRQEGTERIMYPPMADKETFQAKSLAISFIRQRYSTTLQNIQETCHVEFNEKGSDTEVTLKPKSDCDPYLYKDAFQDFSKLLQSASQGMVTWELNSKCVKKEEILSLIRHLLTNLPVILDQCKENGAMVVYGDAASVEQVKLHLKEAINEPNDDELSSALAAAQFMDPVESSSLSIEMFSHRTKDGINISLRYGDITSEDVDAIVNPANDFLVHGLGLAKSIVRKGGYEIINESIKLMAERSNKPLEVGEAVYTGAGDLPCKFVIHAVGPEWHKQSEKRTLMLLDKTCFESLHLASALQLSSVALPAISSGVFGVPINVCAIAILNAIQSFLAYLNKLNEQNKEEGAKTKEQKGNNQKKKIDKKHDSMKQPESQAKSDVGQTFKSEKQKPRLSDIRVVLIDADAMDFFLKEFTARFHSDQTKFVCSVEDDQVA